MFGCASHQEQQAAVHTDNIQKWRELAKYANNALEEYGVVITTELSVQDKQFVLTNFSLAQSETYQNINLLNPRFHHKYVCNPVCTQLLEYIEISDERGTTLLNEYFKKHEVDLFHLYGDLFQLNKTIANLRTIDQPNLKRLLNYLADKNIKFRSPTAFSKYLSRQLTPRNLEKFSAQADKLEAIQQRKANAKTQAFSWYQEHYQYQGNKETRDWDSERKVNAHLASWNLSDHEVETLPTMEHVAWVPNEPTVIEWDSNHETKTHWQTPNESQQYISKNERINQFNIALNNTIKINNNVCTYKNNLFGVVKEVSGKEIRVLVMGQGKEILDGLIQDIPDGAMFSDADSMSFLPLDYEATFQNDEVALCAIN